MMFVFRYLLYYYAKKMKIQRHLYRECLEGPQAGHQNRSVSANSKIWLREIFARQQWALYVGFYLQRRIIIKEVFKMNATMVKCFSIESESITAKSSPSTDTSPVHSEKHIQSIICRLPVDIQNTTTFSYSSSQNGDKLLEQIMKWFEKKGIRQCKAEDIQRSINALHRKTVANTHHHVDLSKSTCLAEKRKGKHLFISV